MPERDEQRCPSATVAPSRLPPWLAPAHLVVALLLKARERVAPKSSAVTIGQQMTRGAEPGANETGSR